PARMLGIEAARHTLQRLVRADLVPGADERSEIRGERVTARVDERRAEAPQLVPVHHVLPRRGEHLVGADVKVERRGGGRTLASAAERNVAADVRLVRRLI